MERLYVVTMLFEGKGNDIVHEAGLIKANSPEEAFGKCYDKSKYRENCSLNSKLVVSVWNEEPVYSLSRKEAKVIVAMYNNLRKRDINVAEYNELVNKVQDSLSTYDEEKAKERKASEKK